MSEDRARMDGIKRATVNFQVRCFAITITHSRTRVQLAAGTFSHLLSSTIPKLIFPPDAEGVPLDLSEPSLKSLEKLMLAQAQECSWQMAKLSEGY